MTDTPKPKQAACLVCRRSKIKCDWASPDGRCKRCMQLGTECIRPDFHAGRQKGIKKYVPSSHIPFAQVESIELTYRSCAPESQQESRT